jgi:sugar phosphate permease
MGLERFGGRIWLSMLTFLFGLVCFCTAFIQNFTSLIAMRLLLGLVEGGILPGYAFYLSKFYRRYELVTRMGAFYSATLLSGFFGGFLAAGLVQIPAFGPIHTWRNIFFFEGLIPMILAGVLFWILPKEPINAKFLNAEDKQFAQDRIQQENILSGAEVGENVSWRHIKIAFTSTNNWLAALTYACFNVPTQSFFLFLPTIIASMGYQANLANLMSGAPFLLGTLNLLLQTWISDKIKRRGLVICYELPFFALAFALELAFSSTPYLFAQAGLRYMALFLGVGLGNVCGPLTLGVRRYSFPYQYILIDTNVQ